MEINLSQSNLTLTKKFHYVNYEIPPVLGRVGIPPEIGPTLPYVSVHYIIVLTIK